MAAISPLFSRRSSSGKMEDFDVIPPSPPSRTLVLCFHSGNGLGPKFDSSNSAVKTFCDLLVRDDRQRVYEVSPIECRELHVSTVSDKVAKFLYKDCGMDLCLDIMTAYHDLVSCYQPGDKISLFGFSRGAYTARALAEMIHKVGLLPKTVDPEKDIWLAYSLYLLDTYGDKTNIAKFKELKPFQVRIDFVGVWDTVLSVGDVIPLMNPFARCNTSIRAFRHALALHEPRAHLRPKFCQVRGTHQASCVNPYGRWSRQFDTQKGKDVTDVQEVWFAGSHCDIGGCAVPEDTPHSLGRIPLRWMVRECFKANTGIQFRAEGLREIGLDPASLYPVVADRPRPLEPQRSHFNSVAPRVPVSSEEEHDVRDALSATHDQFTVFAPLWWMLEFLPIWRRVPVGPPPESKEPKTRIRMSLPRGLVVPKDRPRRRFYVHPTVRTRIQAGL